MGVGRDREKQEKNGRGPREKDQHTVCKHRQWERAWREG